MIGLWLGVAIGGLLACCITAISARSLREFSRRDLEAICLRRSQKRRFGEILRSYDRVALAVESLQIILVASWVIFLSIQLWQQYNASDSQETLLAFYLRLIVAVFVLLSCTLWIPIAVVKLWSAPVLYYTWKTWHLLAKLLFPLSICGQFFNTVFYRLAGRVPDDPSEDTFEHEIRSIVTEGHREGVIEEDAREMIEGVIELSDAVVSEVMTPRTDMTSIHVDMPWDKMVQLVIEVGHTRIPVIDKNRDDVIGILYAKDLLPELAKDPTEPKRSINEILRDAYFVPETKPLDDLLEDFQEMTKHMAIVLDEYGGVSGLVTIEDLLEEIVGEIVDEYDTAVVELIHRIDSRTVEALARTHIDEINEEMKINLPDDGDFDTIGGFVFTRLGKVPKHGEEVVWQTVRIKVLEVTKRRIERVRITDESNRQRETA